jgi:hypothetical protein
MAAKVGLSELARTDLTLEIPPLLNALPSNLYYDQLGRNLYEKWTG